MIWYPSPNFGERTLPITMLVLHYTGMKSGPAAIEWLANPASKVSAHYVVEEDGQIVHMVREEQRAQHAGLSYWRGVTDCNSASIGIAVSYSHLTLATNKIGDNLGVHTSMSKDN